MKKNILLLIFVFSWLTSCTNASKPKNSVEFKGIKMTIPYSILIGHSLTRQEQKLLERNIDEIFDKIDTTYNKWNPLSEISKINNLDKNQPLTISEELSQFLNFVQSIVYLTDHFYDPTIEPLQKLWVSKLNKKTMPSQKEIDEIMPAIGWHNLHINKNIIYKDHPKTKLDLSGIAKGLAIDLLITRIQNLGYNNALVEWGGEIRTIGSHPEGRPWSIFIRNINAVDLDNAIDRISLIDKAIATSGDYLQFWDIVNAENGQTLTYFHIINPKTGIPLTTNLHSIASVSVTAPSCAFADAIATACMVAGNKEQAIEWSEKIKGLFPFIDFWIANRSQ